MYPHLFKILALTPDQKDFLANREKQILKSQPKWSELKKKLLSLGGEAIAMQYEDDMDQLLAQGKSYNPSRAKLKPGYISECHYNVASLYEAEKDKGFKIIVGWALSDDQIWRQHTFGFQNNRVIETTEPRTAYFGFPLNDEESEAFVYNNQ